MDDSERDHNLWEAELFRLLVENTTDYAVFVVDLHGRVLTWNPGAERVLGYAENEIIGRSSAIFFTPEDRERGVPEVEIQKCLKYGRAGDDRWHLRKDGHLLWVNGAMTLLRDESGEARGFAKVMRDLTSEKMSADAFRESEGRLRVALEAAEMGTWLWRIPTDEQILDESPKHLMGLAVDGLVMTLDAFIAAVLPEDAARVRTAFEQCLLSRTDFHVEFRVRWLDGSVHWLRDQGKLFYNDEGQPLFMTGACVDITARKRYEEELSEADRKKDEFLALLAHELRNPLAPLRNGLQVMRLASDANIIQDVRTMMDRQLGHMVRLVDDLLDVSRLSQDKLHLHRSQILLADVIATSVESVRPVLEAAQLELSISLPIAPVFLTADMTRLAQVFSNLLTNSAKFTPPGGRVWVTARRQENEVEVAVRDSGIGIPGPALEHIFDMFAQVDRSNERTTGGLGIGLALVKGLVEMHGGKVTASSDGLNQGSTFTIVLPCDATPITPEGECSTERESESPTIANRRILVVDDNRDSAHSMSSLLSIHGNEVRVAHDGIEADGTAETFRPDLILMDVGMPQMNGYRATREIRQKPWGKNIVIIALTGWGKETDRQESRSAGCDGHLVKPVSLADLIDLIVELENRVK